MPLAKASAGNTDGGTRTHTSLRTTDFESVVDLRNLLVYQRFQKALVPIGDIEMSESIDSPYLYFFGAKQAYDSEREKLKLRWRQCQSRVGAELKRRRALAKIGLREMARAIGCSAPFLSDLESGRRDWTGEWVMRVEQMMEGAHTWHPCEYAEAQQHRSRLLTGSIGLEGKWTDWIEGKPEKVLMNRQYEYRSTEPEQTAPADAG